MFLCSKIKHELNFIISLFSVNIEMYVHLGPDQVQVTNWAESAQIFSYLQSPKSHKQPAVKKFFFLMIKDSS